MPDNTAQTLTEFLNDSTLNQPQAFDLDIATQQISTLFESQDGATFSLYFGDMSGQRFYAVALYPEGTIRLRGRRLPSEIVREFLTENRELLNDPRNSIGVWYSSETQRTYLDISSTIRNRRQAITLGRRYNQEAVYSLATGEIIDTGGSGEVLDNPPPSSERLPPLRRRLRKENRQ